MGKSEHLSFIQKRFGISVGIGIWVRVNCSLPRNATESESRRVIRRSETLNVTSFEDSSEELVRQGIMFKYKPFSKSLTIVIRFRRLQGAEMYQQHLVARGMILGLQDDDTWPLHHDIEINGSTVHSYNYQMKTVRLRNNEQLSLDAALDILIYML